LRQRSNASTCHDKNNDDGKRLRQARSLVPVIPKLEPTPASIRTAPGAEKISRCRKDVALRPGRHHRVRRDEVGDWSAAATFEGEFSNVTSSYAGKGIVRYAW
jgi:hypothetical protein